MNLSNLLTRIFYLFLGIAILPQLLIAHGDEIPNDPGIAKDHFTVYGQSERYELTLYYPELEAKKDVHLTLYLADYQSNRPIDQAKFKISTLEDPKLVFEAEQIAPGVYELHGSFPEHKTYTLNFQN